METAPKPTKILYPVLCKVCKKHITDIQISADLWDKRDPESLGVSNLKCSEHQDK